MSPLVTCLHKKHELQYSMYTSAGKYSHISHVSFGKILINKMSKPRRKNYIYDRNFIVKISFQLRSPVALPRLFKKIYFIQSYTKKKKKSAMHKSLYLGFCIPILLK